MFKEAVIAFSIPTCGFLIYAGNTNTNTNANFASFPKPVLAKRAI